MEKSLLFLVVFLAFSKEARKGRSGLVLGRPQVCPGDFTAFVPGTNPVKTWDTPPGTNAGISWDTPGVFSLFYTVEARFHRVCPWDKPGLSQEQSRGRRAAQKVYVKKIYVPFSLAIIKEVEVHPLN